MISTLEKHRTACSRKRHYSSEREALKAVENFKSRIYENPLIHRPIVAYQCYACTMWCIGHVATEWSKDA